SASRAANAGRRARATERAGDTASVTFRFVIAAAAAAAAVAVAAARARAHLAERVDDAFEPHAARGLDQHDVASLADFANFVGGVPGILGVEHAPVETRARALIHRRRLRAHGDEVVGALG